MRSMITTARPSQRLRAHAGAQRTHQLLNESAPRGTLRRHAGTLVVPDVFVAGHDREVGEVLGVAAILQPDGVAHLSMLALPEVSER